MFPAGTGLFMAYDERNKPCGFAQKLGEYRSLAAAQRACQEASR
jgi:hypothetical protein